MTPDDVPPHDPSKPNPFAEASIQAQNTFRYFWRELAYESKRPAPCLDLACVKVPFSDPDQSSKVEHMWISDVTFDGKIINGELINEPNTLTDVKIGDQVGVSLNEISDWMYAISENVYGAYSVNLIRSKMSARERKAHDAKWGFDFGNPEKIRLFPMATKHGKDYFTTLLSNENDPAPEDHLICRGMGAEMEKFLGENPSQIDHFDIEGWTMLHREALLGCRLSVEILLKKGANPHLKTKHGMTALDLARCLQWKGVIELLESL